ncbi:MAG: cell division protein FtsX [Proteobacteria bacterium]|nr:cell division protein FtsX [Pseudomonadota bacterium]NOG60654.1 cell division protein FtsX [Pseudomonadota bacterium]
MKPVNKKKNTRPDKSFKSELKRRFDMLLLQHMQAFIFSLGQYLKYPLSNVLTTAVIGISLALPASFYLLLDNVRFVSSSWDGSLQVTLFLKTDIDNEQALSFASKLKENNKINEAILIKREDALAEYQKLSGFADALNALDENPLPNVILVKPAVNGTSETDTESLVNELEALPEVDSAQYDSKWIQRLIYLLDIVNRLIIILSTLLAIGVLLIVGNTIRLSIYNRRAEIEITKLFGGTDSFIQRPFLYSGLWYGAFGGIIAWVLITVSMQMLRGPVKQLANLYASDFQLIGLGFINSVLLIAIGIALGLVGSWISVKRHLKAIDPV